MDSLAGVGGLHQLVEEEPFETFNLRLETLRQLLIEGEQSGDAGELDISAIKRKARQLAGVGARNAQGS